MSLKHLYSEPLGLLTDFYQLTMCYAYWKAGLDKKRSVFHLFFRKKPFHGGFALTAGLEGVIDYIENFAFHNTDLEYLSTQKSATGAPLFEKDFLIYLKNLRFTCDIDAIPEGRVVFPYEPLLRIEGPLIECQLLESILLNLINFPSLIATKAARIRQATEGDPIMEFGLRRAQGIDGALTAARASFIGGCSYTSNVLAGKLFGIPLVGTHSHSFVMVFDDEEESFRTYAKYLPDQCVFLVDTYNTLEGVKKAIKVANWLKNEGKELKGIRLDSGDLTVLSQKARDLLDQAGLYTTKIFATNDLDEHIIHDLKKQHCKIDLFGVGTRLITAYDQPALDGVYKLSAIKDEGGPWKYRLKLSEQMIKISNPGVLQVARYSNGEEFTSDAIYDINLGLGKEPIIVDPLDPTRQKAIRELKKEDLLLPIYRKGKLVYVSPPLKEIQEKALKELGRFQKGIKRFLNPQEYIVGLEKKLYDLKIELIKKVRQIT